MISLNIGKPDADKSLEINHILETGKISRKEHQKLMNRLLSDRQLSESDRRQINQIFDALKVGKIRLT